MFFLCFPLKTNNSVSYCLDAWFTTYALLFPFGSVGYPYMSLSWNAQQFGHYPGL
jgi:hypothetical protein